MTTDKNIMVLVSTTPQKRVRHPLRAFFGWLTGRTKRRYDMKLMRYEPVRDFFRGLCFKAYGFYRGKEYRERPWGVVVHYSTDELPRK